MPESALGEAEAVPRCDVVVANAEVPGRLERGLRFRVRVFVELVAERYAAEAELKFGRVNPGCAILHRARILPRTERDEKLHRLAQAAEINGMNAKDFFDSVI
jgi:hypothetical protein